MVSREVDEDFLEIECGRGIHGPLLEVCSHFVSTKNMQCHFEQDVVLVGRLLGNSYCYTYILDVGNVFLHSLCLCMLVFLFSFFKVKRMGGGGPSSTLFTAVK